MVKMHMIYDGDLRCRLTHEPSGNVITTDAPVDNMGKGEAFSPTDLLAASLGSCMLTVMGIAAKRNEINMNGAMVYVEKEMITQPLRRIGKIGVRIQMPSGIAPAKRELLEQAAHNCPVQKSLNPDIQIPVIFEYND
ncbi:MAG: OsmC family protein [Candidatus Omnitrophica bacterium]|nr:OsmC family protein [Candidatus Omnitrophota bacterium]